MRALIPLVCSIALGATVARAQVNGPITISPHDDTQWNPPSAATPGPHAAAPTAPETGTAGPANPAPAAPTAAAQATPTPPAASLAPPVTTPSQAPKRSRQAMPRQMPPDLYGSPGGPPEGGMPEFPQGGRPHGLRARFQAANVTHDGRLTPEQAMMGMPGVARHFAEIDRDNRGFVTMQQIRAWRRARRRQNMMPEPGTQGPQMPGRAMPGPAPEPGGPDQEQ